MNSRTYYPIQAVRIAFASPKYAAMGLASFAVFLVLYAFVLPATYTGGRVGLVSLKFINFKLAVFAFLFSILLALIVPFAVYTFGRRYEQQKNSSTAGSVLGSVLPPLLCCSPILPTVAAFAGGAFPFAFGVSGLVQGFIATYETYIFSVMVAILLYSLYQNSKHVVYANRGVCKR